MCQNIVDLLTCGCITLRRILKSGTPYIHETDKRHGPEDDRTCGKDPCPTQVAAQLKSLKQREKDKAYWKEHDEKLAKARKEVAEWYASGRRKPNGVVLGRGLLGRDKGKKVADEQIFGALADTNDPEGRPQGIPMDRSEAMENSNEFEMRPLMGKPANPDQGEPVQFDRSKPVDKPTGPDKRKSGVLSHGLQLYSVYEEDDDEDQHDRYAHESKREGTGQSQTYRAINKNEIIADDQGTKTGLGHHCSGYESPFGSPLPTTRPDKKCTFQSGSTQNYAASASSRTGQSDFGAPMQINVIAKRTGLKESVTDPGFRVTEWQPSIIGSEPDHDNNEGSDNDEWWFDPDQKALLGESGVDQPSTPTKTVTSANKGREVSIDSTNHGTNASPQTPKLPPCIYSNDVGSGTYTEEQGYSPGSGSKKSWVHQVKTSTPTRTHSSCVTRYQSQKAAVVSGEELDYSTSNLDGAQSSTPTFG